MPSAKPLTKEQIIAAMSQTLSNKAAARYLHVSYVHYKKWAKTYDATEEGYENLFEQHKNQAGKGIPKFLRADGPEPALLDIIEGRVDASSFSPDKLKYRLITEGFLKEECSVCGFHERRVNDYKIPLLLNFKDKNKKITGKKISNYFVITIISFKLGTYSMKSKLKPLKTMFLLIKTK